MRLKYISYSLLLLWIISANSSSATNHQVLSPLPDKVAEQWNNFSLVGQTTLRKFGFHIYDSSLWSIDGKLGDTSLKDSLSECSCALSITYARKIKLEKLLSSTRKEWQRLGFAKSYPINAWLTMLKNIWPSVGKGDQLVAVVTKEGKTIFFNKNNSLGTIDDANFGPAFLSIWLDENSRFKKNRRELLGE